MKRIRELSVHHPILDEMLILARCSKRQPIIVAGAKSTEIMRELHRRGYLRAIDTAHSGLPRGQYDIALLDWRQRSTKALPSTLDWLVSFLMPTGVLVIWVDPQDSAGNRTLRMALQTHGLIIEAGTNLVHGSAVSARRCETYPMSKAA
jgi:hypothetical protein